MKKYDVINKIQIKEYEKIVLAQVGAFYIAIGIDAYLLHEILGLNLNRYAKDKFKVGIPTNALEKYITLLEEKSIAFCVYQNDDNNNLYKIHENNSGKFVEDKSIFLYDKIIDLLFHTKIMKCKIIRRYFGECND